MTWRERVAAAQARGRFTADDRDLVTRWHTCAVGEQRVQQPTVVVAMPNTRSTPVDGALWCSGVNFTDAVLRNDVREAYRWLDAIEDRVLELKRSQ